MEEAADADNEEEDEDEDEDDEGEGEGEGEGEDALTVASSTLPLRSPHKAGRTLLTELAFGSPSGGGGGGHHGALSARGHGHSHARMFGAVVEQVRALLRAGRATLYLVDRASRKLVSRMADLPEIAEMHWSRATWPAE